MSNNVVLDINSSEINMSPKNELMRLVFDDLRKNRPKPLPESWDLSTFRVQTKFLSMPNLAVMDKNSFAKASEVRWHSVPNLKFLQVTNDYRIPELSEHRDSEISLEGTLCISIPDSSVHSTLPDQTPAEIGWRSTSTDLMVPQVSSDIQIPEPTEHRDSEISMEGTLCIYIPRIAVNPNFAGDAPDLGLPSVTSIKTELPVLNTTQDTDGVPETAEVKQRRPRRSFWGRTKKFVKRLFCCCGSVDTIDQ